MRISLEPQFVLDFRGELLDRPKGLKGAGATGEEK